MKFCLESVHFTDILENIKVKKPIKIQPIIIVDKIQSFII